MREFYVYPITLFIIASCTLVAQQENNAVQPEGQEEVPVDVRINFDWFKECIRREISSDAHFRCDGCGDHSTLSFLMCGEPGEEDQLYRCFQCGNQYHGRCMNNGRCLSCSQPIDTSVDSSSIINGEQEGQQPFQERAEVRVQADWSFAYAQQDVLLKRLFARLLIVWQKVFSGQLQGQIDIEQLLDGLREDPEFVSGDTCSICLADSSIITPLLGGSQLLVGCRRCSARFHLHCSQRWRATHFMPIFARCPGCNLMDYMKFLNHPPLGYDAMLEFERRPGVQRQDQTSFTLAIRSEAYKRACRALITALDRPRAHLRRYLFNQLPNFPRTAHLEEDRRLARREQSEGVLRELEEARSNIRFRESLLEMDRRRRAEQEFPELIQARNSEIQLLRARLTRITDERRNRRYRADQLLRRARIASCVIVAVSLSGGLCVPVVTAICGAKVGLATYTLCAGGVGCGIGTYVLAKQAERAIGFVARAV